MSHFFLKKGREFSETGRGRRACLVALFQFPDRPPAVLIDVDHTGLRGLAAMMLRYTAECPFADVEGHIKTLLDALVDNSGKWDREVEAGLPSFVTCTRQKKVLRRQGERTPDEMLSVWTDRLLNRLVAAWVAAGRTRLSSRFPPGLRPEGYGKDLVRRPRRTVGHGETGYRPECQPNLTFIAASPSS